MTVSVRSEVGRGGAGGWRQCSGLALGRWVLTARHCVVGTTTWVDLGGACLPVRDVVALAEADLAVGVQDADAGDPWIPSRSADACVLVRAGRPPLDYHSPVTCGLELRAKPQGPGAIAGDSGAPLVCGDPPRALGILARGAPGGLGEDVFISLDAVMGPCGEFGWWAAP